MRNSRACLSYQVSRIQNLTVIESRGRVLHLLKESTKPVPKPKKRRMIAALPIPDEIVVIPGITKPRESLTGDKSGGNEETKEPPRSKRNKTPMNSLL